MGALEQEGQNIDQQNDSSFSRDNSPEDNSVKQVEKPRGYDPVDLSGVEDEGLRKQLEDRLGYYHHQVKDYGRKLTKTEKELNHFRELATKEIERLAGVTNEVYSHVQNQTIADAETAIKQQMKVAFESGDNDSYINAQEKLLEIKAKKLVTNQTQERLQQKTQQPQQVEQSFENSPINYEEASVINSWQEQKDASGNYVRDWCYEESPLYEQALMETKAVLYGPRFQNLSINEKLKEIDRRMGLNSQSNSQSQAVIGGNLTQAPKKVTIGLTEQQKKLAVKTRFGGPSAKTDAEHIEAYRKSLEKVSKTTNQQRKRS